MTTHTYATHLTWSGSTAAGYRTYPREHRAGGGAHGAAGSGAAQVTLSAAPEFRGDPALLNPEQLLVMAASSCQLLSFLGAAARAGVDVVGYDDDAHGVMPLDDAPARLTRIVLTPVVRVSAGTDHDVVRALVEQAHAACYVAHSLTADVHVAPTVVDA